MVDQISQCDSKIKLKHIINCNKLIQLHNVSLIQ